MTSEKRKKLNKLMREWPSGTPLTHADLEKNLIYQQLVSYYIQSGWLEPIGRGAFKKAGDVVGWLDALAYLQTAIKKDVHLAGKTALEFSGVQHFSHSNNTSVWLFGGKGQRLPSWFLCDDTEQAWGRKINYLTPLLFHNDKLGLHKQHFDQLSCADSEISLSSIERAVLELLYLVPKKQSLEEAKYLIEGLVTLRPKLLQNLLEQCCSVKVKRLFVFLADFCHLPVLKHLNISRLILGSGKRVIGEGGHYVAKHQLSIPKSFINTFQEEFLDYE